MRILYDGFIYAQTAGGINRYFSRIINKLPDNYAPTLTVSCFSEIDRPSHPQLQLVKYKRFWPEKISFRLEKYFFRTAVNTQGYDLIHPTYYSLLSMQEVKTLRAPVVVTVWDMLHEIFAEQLDPSGQQAEKKRKAITAAQAIICISENTKKDLLERYPSVERKVSVTYLAPGIDASISYGPEATPVRPYYIYVGGRWSYKNFGGLLAAFAKVISSYPDIALCIVGAPFNQTEEKLIAELKLSHNIEHYGYLNDSHLAKLYRHSIALVYPSLYEGFGLPPLEAMACGTAVVAANCSSIPEVVGDAGLLFNHKSKDDLADSLLHLLANPISRNNLISAGYRRLQAFSWEKTVSQTLNVYRSVSNHAETAPPETGK
jgi:glycosyltransferase involved in cell wall biosynthesis